MKPGTPRRRPVYETTRTPEVVTTFLWLYADDGQKVELSSGTDFSGLDGLMGRTELENFETLLAQLQQRAPGAAFDHRMERLARWSLTMLKDGDSHEAMAELLWQAVLAGYWRP